MAEFKSESVDGDVFAVAPTGLNHNRLVFWLAGLVGQQLAARPCEGFGSDQRVHVPEGYDRGRKFEHYRTIESLREYVLVAQDRVRVDTYTRQPDGRWLLTSASSLEDVIELTSIDCKVPRRRVV